jgi:dethiobiotin synthetase
MPSTRGVFVTGTDTGIGKTWVACALLRALSEAGIRSVGMKPVAAGIDLASGINDDVGALACASNVDAPPGDRNPYAFPDAVAPHLAARAANASIDLAPIASAYARLADRADAIVVEGAGGALVPLDERRDMLDIAVALRLPVLLVVGMRLGCLNHAFLTTLAVRERGLALAGWVANDLPPGMSLLDANIATITTRIGAPPLAVCRPDASPSFDEVALALLGFR